jgi:hypothetical protein
MDADGGSGVVLVTIPPIFILSSQSVQFVCHGSCKFVSFLVGRPCTSTLHMFIHDTHTQWTWMCSFSFRNYHKSPGDRLPCTSAFLTESSIPSSYFPRLLSAWNIIRPITRPRKLRTSILIPLKLLCSDRTCTPAIRRILHAMVNDPILSTVQ